MRASKVLRACLLVVPVLCSTSSRADAVTDAGVPLEQKFPPGSVLKVTLFGLTDDSVLKNPELVPYLMSLGDATAYHVTQTMPGDFTLQMAPVHNVAAFRRQLPAGHPLGLDNPMTVAFTPDDTGPFAAALAAFAAHAPAPVTKTPEPLVARARDLIAVYEDYNVVLAEIDSPATARKVLPRLRSIATRAAAVARAVDQLQPPTLEASVDKNQALAMALPGQRSAEAAHLGDADRVAGVPHVITPDLVKAHLALTGAGLALDRWDGGSHHAPPPPKGVGVVKIVEAEPSADQLAAEKIAGQGRVVVVYLHGVIDPQYEGWALFLQLSKLMPGLTASGNPMAPDVYRAVVAGVADPRQLAAKITFGRTAVDVGRRTITVEVDPLTARLLAETRGG